MRTLIISGLLALAGNLLATALPTSTPSALHVAVLEGKTETVERLLDRGADPNIRDQDGRTPLHLAAAETLPEILELLLAAGADADAEDDHGRSVMDYGLNAMLDYVDDELERLGPTAGRFKPGDIPPHASIDLVERLLRAGATSPRIQARKNWIISANGRTAFPYVLSSKVN